LIRSKVITESQNFEIGSCDPGYAPLGSFYGPYAGRVCPLSNDIARGLGGSGRPITREKNVVTLKMRICLTHCPAKAFHNFQICSL